MSESQKQRAKVMEAKLKEYNKRKRAESKESTTCVVGTDALIPGS